MTLSKISLFLGIVFTGILLVDYLDMVMSAGRLAGVAFNSGLATMFLLLAIYFLIDEKINQK